MSPCRGCQPTEDVLLARAHRGLPSPFGRGDFRVTNREHAETPRIALPVRFISAPRVREATLELDPPGQDRVFLDTPNGQLSPELDWSGVRLEWIALAGPSSFDGKTVLASAWSKHVPAFR